MTNPFLAAMLEHGLLSYEAAQILACAAALRACAVTGVTDPRVHAAIDAAERYAIGRASRAELETATSGVCEAIEAQRDAAIRQTEMDTDEWRRCDAQWYATRAAYYATSDTAKAVQAALAAARRAHGADWRAELEAQVADIVEVMP